jgi:uncharacterized membrane protein YbhN (UPF0104 family)
VSRARRVRLIVQTAVTVGILVALIIILNPGQLGRDVARFPIAMVPVAIGLTTCFYLVKGLRYHQLLRGEGVRVALRHTLLYSVGGEAFGLLPLGELARGEITSEATGAPIGTTAAVVTVQELLYTTVIVVVAIPGALAYAAGISGILVSLAAIVAILGILTVGPVFHAVLSLVRRIPGARRAAAQLEILHEQTLSLLRRPGTWLWVVLSVLGALIELTLFWLVVWGASGDAVPWVTTTFIYGAAYLAGAATSPGGGVGGFEGTAIALLGAHGVAGPAAVAAALLQRAADKGVITLAGFTAWFWIRRHLRVRRGLLLGDGEGVAPQPAPVPAGAAAPAAVLAAGTAAAARPEPVLAAVATTRAPVGAARAAAGGRRLASRAPGGFRRRLAASLVTGTATLVAAIATVAQRPW